MIRDTLHNYPNTPTAVPAGYPAIRVALISCGKSKRPHPAPARDLYTGPLFVDARRYVEAAVLAGELDAWFILSARYGLVSPYTVLGPYEATMEAKTGDQLTTWVNRVDSAMRSGSLGANLGEFSQWGGKVTVDIYAGAAYVDPLMAFWTRLPWTVTAPHHGLQLGERRAAFREAGARAA